MIRSGEVLDPPEVDAIEECHTCKYFSRSFVYRPYGCCSAAIDEDDLGFVVVKNDDTCDFWEPR